MCSQANRAISIISSTLVLNFTSKVGEFVSQTSRPLASALPAQHVAAPNHVWTPSSISLRAWSICCGVSFGLRPNFTPRRLRGLHSGAGPFADKAAFQARPVRQSSATWRGLSASRCRLPP